MWYNKSKTFTVWYHKKNSIEFRYVMERFFCKKILTVLICQNDQMQGHKHRQRAQISEGSSDGVWKARITQDTQSIGNTTSDPINDGVNGTSRTGKETRSKNATVRLWKRIS